MYPLFSCFSVGNLFAGKHTDPTCTLRVGIKLTLITVLIPGAIFAQPVVSDGETLTIVTPADSGAITVQIAPTTTASISHNTYSSFSVPSAGVNLDNTTVRARTIVNEVTSANITTIKGQLAVIGPKADVIIANPNGIVVNDGRFVNTGNVALTTGVLGYNSNNVLTSTVNAGEITIGAGGLSGMMEELALVSKTLKINGSISYDAPDAFSHVNTITGESVVSFDRDRNGAGVDGQGFLPWALATGRGTTTTDAIVVDITEPGSLSTGRISMTVTDQGAGVRFAGDQLASAGEFVLTSSGQLEMLGSSITAQDSVRITTGEVTLASNDGERSEISSSENGVVIRTQAGDIDLGQSRIAGRTAAPGVFDPDEGEVVRDSEGGVTLIAAGNITSFRDGTLTAELVSDIGELDNPQQESNVIVRANGDIRFDGLDVSTTDDFRAEAGGIISFEDAIGNIGGNLEVLSEAAVSFDTSDFTAQSDIDIDGVELRFGSEDAAQDQTSLIAVTGGLFARSNQGDILNFGSFLQGNNASLSNPDITGGVIISSAGLFLNQSLSFDRRAVVFGNEDDLIVEAAGDVRNETGRLLSNGGILVNAGGDIINETDFTVEAQPLLVERIRGKRFASSLFLKRGRRTKVSGNFGEEAIIDSITGIGEQSFITGVGDVSLNGQTIRSIGADITGGAVSINAADEFVNATRQVGAFRFKQSCKWFCKTSGKSSLRFVGGTVTASEDLTLTAGTRITNLAGTVNASTGITINAPLTEFTPLLSLNLIERPAGATGFFRGQAGFLDASFRFGSLQAFSGDITINGDLDLGDGNLFPFSGEVIITGTRVETAPPEIPKLFERRPIGFVGNAF